MILTPIEGLSFEAKIVIGMALWMGIWWITDAILIYVTSLLPLVIFPIFNIADFAKTSSFYADRIVFLLLGGFFIAAAIEKNNLHQRFAFNLLKFSGTNSKYIVGSFVIITGGLSAWMSNTATTLLMLPIASAVISSININNKERFSTCMVLCIAYAASIGGIGTLIGTSPNAVFASLSKSIVGVEVSFVQWMIMGLPISAVLLFVMWLYMVNVGIKLNKTIISGKENFVQKNSRSLESL